MIDRKHVLYKFISFSVMGNGGDDCSRKGEFFCETYAYVVRTYKIYFLVQCRGCGQEAWGRYLLALPPHVQLHVVPGAPPMLLPAQEVTPANVDSYRFKIIRK